MRLILALAACLWVVGCAAPPKKDFAAFNAAAPRSILVVPTINKSLDVDAPNFVLAALPIPVAEKGFYVFPVNTTKYVLEQEGYYEGERIHQQPAPELAKLFGADAILYVAINRWDAQFVLFTTNVTVDFDYRMVAKDGTEIWRENKKLQYQSQNSSGGLLVAVISAAIERAAPNYMPLTRQANQEVFFLSPNAIPNGPHRRVAGSR